MELYWDKEQKNDLLLKMGLFCFVPFLAFLYSFYRLNTKSSHFILFLCACLFAMSMTPDLTTGLDSVHYVNEFERIKQLDSSYVVDLFVNYVHKYEYIKDLYAYPTIYYVSRVTSNYHWMFLTFVLLPAFFCLRSLRYITQSYQFGIFTAFLLVIFLSHYNMFSINGVRFVAAMWMTVYAALSFYQTKKTRSLLLLPLAYFIHHSFIYFILLFFLARLLYRFIKVTPKRLLLSLLIASYLLGSYAVELIDHFSNYFPANVQRMMKGYTDLEYMETIHSANIENSWQRRGEFFIRVYINLIMSLIIFNYKNLFDSKNVFLSKVFALSVICLVVNNMFAMVPSLGTRYLSHLVPFVLVLVANANYSKVLHRVIYISPIVYFINAYVLLGYMKSTHSISVLYESVPLFFYRYLF